MNLEVDSMKLLTLLLCELLRKFGSVRNFLSKISNQKHSLQMRI